MIDNKGDCDNMKRIVFKYKDKYTNGNWSTQTCTCRSVEECKRFYGLGIDPDCEYKIVSVEDEQYDC